MPALDQLIPLYLTACTVEGKTDRTVQSYDETLRQFRRAGRELGLAEDVAAFGPAHVYLSGLPGALRATGEAPVVRLPGGDKDSQERDTKGSGAGQWTVGGSSYGKDADQAVGPGGAP